MRNTMKLPLSLAILSALATPAFSSGFAQQGVETGYSLWGIGRTGVMCYMAPCPWRGIFPISPHSGERGFPISRHNQPRPQVVGADPAITATVTTAYSENRCLIVEALLLGDGLDIARIIGEC